MVVASFGESLRDWRQHRGWTQQKLAAHAEVSSRHVSFLETGRAMPSREMVLRLSRHLEIPLRERNRLLSAAGFSPMYRESTFQDQLLEPVRHALEFMIAQHEPFPSVVVDRCWDVRIANRAALGLAMRIAPRALESAPLNMMRLLFDPELGARACILNLHEVMPEVLRRLREEANQLDAQPRQRALYEAMSRFAPSDLPAHDTAMPLLPLHLATDGIELRLYTAITTLGTPTDITLQEMRIETYFPADPESAARLRGLPIADASARSSRP